ncbi:uncharacterized protein AB675_4689 [Cyphellophora attinorum]|uniref:RNase III domain-containing protein n=1 Tax=Cyphellophora attinorum TaxID=1664694 RepID=A0A0N0NL65_9EURO|nr:uncharacterized protein AB675_4689 [Phialophora attinorum]KPI38941.1 hypothetical protein AB675_4689 [Phialophora attinorum]
MNIGMDNRQFFNAASDCQLRLGYAFTRLSHLARALNGSGNRAQFGESEIVESNKPLAIYGDALMQTLLAKKWLNAGLSPDQWTRDICQTLLTNKNLAEVGTDNGIRRFILCSGGTRPSDKMTATAVEAIIGAAHLDGGDDAANLVMENLGITSPLLEESSVKGDPGSRSKGEPQTSG